MKKKESLISVQVILLVLSVLTILFCIYLVYNKNKELKSEQTMYESSIKYENSIKKINSAELEDLYSQFTVLEEPYSDYFGYFYKIDKKIQSKDFNDGVKIIFAINRLLKEKYNTNLSKVASNSKKYINKVSFSKDEVVKKVKELLGDDTTYTEDLGIRVKCAEFEFKDNQYILKEGTECEEPVTKLERQIVYTKEDKDRFSIKEKYMFRSLYGYDEKTQKMKGNLYKNISKDGKFMESDLIGSYYYEEDALVRNLSIDRYLNKLNILQYNFAKNNYGNYYLESVEIIKK